MPAETDTEVVESDAKPDSSTSSVEQDAKPTGKDSSSTETQSKGSEKTLGDVVKETLAKHSESQTEADEEQEGDVQQSDSTEQEAEKTVEGEEEPETEEEESAEGDVDAEDKVPFHDHPRWKKVVEERDTLRTRATELEAKVKESDEMVQAQTATAKYCQDNQITPDEFRTALEFMALTKMDPEKALEKLQPIYEGLLAYKGERLPPDLQKEVDAELLSLTRAKEIAQLRAQATFKEKRQEVESRQLSERQREALVNDSRRSLASWEEAHQTKDPDFKPKAKPTDADGKYEWFMEKFQGKLVKSPPRTPQEAVALAEQAYQEVGTAFTRLTANGKARGGTKVLSSTRSSSTRASEPKTIRDVVRQTAARHGVSME